MTYQQEARGADQIVTSAIDAHVQGEQRKNGDDEDGSGGVLVPGGLMARKINNGTLGIRQHTRKSGSDLGLNHLERVTGIAPALSA